MLNKRGQSLVEVVVSLGILAIVLSATITLVVAVVNLALAARVRTEAVAYAQSGMAKLVASSAGGCSINGVATIPEESINGSSGSIDRKGLATPLTSSEAIDLHIADANKFLKARVEVSWNYKGDVGDTNKTYYVIEQLIRIGGE